MLKLHLALFDGNRLRPCLAWTHDLGSSAVEIEAESGLSVVGDFNEPPGGPELRVVDLPPMRTVTSSVSS